MPKTYTIERISIPSTDPRLKRHIYHDERSKLHRFSTARIAELKNVVHERHGPIIDQGNVGCSTGCAGIGALECDPLFKTLPTTETSIYPLNLDGALLLYSDAQEIDKDGKYPPNDNGSCGLSIAKALCAKGVVHSYQHIYTADEAYCAIQEYPIIIGMYWYNDMYHPALDGQIQPTGGIAGGHEVLVREIDVDQKRVWIDNSWGNEYGINGRAWLTFDDFEIVMKNNGDGIVLMPNNTIPPAANPLPMRPPVASTEDLVLAQIAKKWIDEYVSQTFVNKRMRDGLIEWLVSKGL
jgi:hypothetical protein